MLDDKMIKLSKTAKTLLVVSAVLVISVFIFTTLGCSCKKLKVSEGFEDASTEVKEPEVVPVAADGVNSTMNEKEKELFENLKENKFTDDEINKLVKSGVLTDQLVEKFLEKLQTDEALVEGFTLKK